jgi:hypothetical protein
MASLSLNGRMAEISKRDIWCAQRVAQERPDVTYKLIAIDFLPPKVCLWFLAPMHPDIFREPIGGCKTCHALVNLCQSQQSQG